MKIAIVLNCGKTITREIDAKTVICADGGFAYCPVAVNVVVGDSDSLDMPLPEGVDYISHPARKNDTDGTLAVKYAIEELGATQIDFYGVLGGRYDHTLGNFTLMALSNSFGVKCVAKEDDLDIYFAEKGVFELDTVKGELISVLPYGGEALVKSYSGLDYPLVNLRLTPQDTRGISNVAKGKKITLDVAEGEILVFHYLKRI